MTEIIGLDLPGAFEIRPPVHRDPRGTFRKIMHRPTFERHGLSTDFAEEYFTESKDRVLRGLHFQLPPHDHVKLVYCVTGTVLDVAVDLRRDSSTFGRHVMVELSAELGNGVYLPPGLAHGFYVRRGPAILVYKTSTVHAASADSGIRWDSAGIAWPDQAPILSDRDRNLPVLEAFDSPFRMTGCGEAE
ncbi:dTDP-4-dehydrorhamnose 3,5-epimerase family protein [Azospirillum sp. TSO35-2]|uniref:dTDP-4-dehydrorhamnose 3,5-epimerase family protein n=1 Tax=Azospirillum sp. TSO35-2 TaxID=716796 RepID=UPI000D616F93|nr:dTDP-4-dehydrorhamnose 3,5-epimerase family protein [Azospirillum sp. TSO35-2]PWC40460.1 dTDP-4-dehydrorhamnose 3,5-epimerase [Azospirillum sp. TSO35-2]